MKRSRFSEEQIIGLLRQNDAGMTVSDPRGWRGMSWATSYVRKRVYRGMDVSDAHRLKVLEGENAKLKRPHAGAMFDDAGLNALLSKGGEACRQALRGRTSEEEVRIERTAGALHHSRGSQHDPLSQQATRCH